MKIQRPSYEIWLQKPGELGIYQQIERAHLVSVTRFHTMVFV